MGIDATPSVGKLEVGNISASENRSKVLVGSEFWMGNYNGSWDVAFISARDNTTNEIGMDFRVQKPGGGVLSMMVLRPPSTSSGNDDKIYFKSKANFANDADFIGDINYWGTIAYQGSDSRLKSNITPIKEEYVNRLYNLDVKYYTRMYYSPNSISENDSSQTQTKNPSSWQEHGFIAQEFQEVYPDLVAENEEGYLSIQYTALIPLLVEALKEQKAEIDNLKSLLQPVEERSRTDEKNIIENNPILKQVQLFQNHPNPFTEVTRIEYFIPEKLGNGAIYIYDLQGKQIRVEQLQMKNKGYVEINAGKLQPGMYIYSLIVDGVEMGSRRMIITD